MTPAISLRTVWQGAAPWLLGLASAGMATAATRALWPENQHSAFALYYIAVIVCALYGQRLAAWLAMALSVPATNYLFLPPYGDFSLTLEAAYSALLFCTACGAIVFLAQYHETAERRLRESERRFATMVENLPGLVYRCLNDEKWTTEFVSSGSEALTGYAPEELLANRAAAYGDLIVPEDRQRVWETIQHALQAKTRYSIEYRLRSRAGLVKWAWEQGCGVFAPEGRLLALEGFVTDITGQKQAQHEIRDSEERLRLATEAARVGTWDWDLATKRVRWDPALLRLFDLDARRLDNDVEAWLERVHPDDRDRVRAATREALKCDGLYAEEFRIRVRGDGLRWIAAEGRAVRDEAGHALRMTGVAQDVTERKRAEGVLRDHTARLRRLSRQLMEVEEAERRAINRELHDRIGQNLSALNLNLNLVRSALPKTSLRAVGSRFDEVQKLVEETTAQVRNVMAGLHPPALDDYGLLAALRTYASSFGAARNLLVAVSGEEPTPRLAPVAELAMFRIAQEALANAVKHACARRIEIRFTTTDYKATLTVADDGKGFEMQSGTVPRASWGLTIMRERAEAIGASLQIDSRAGRGTSLIVEVSREAA